MIYSTNVSAHFSAHFSARVSARVSARFSACFSGTLFGRTFRAHLSGTFFGRVFRARLSGTLLGRACRAPCLGVIFGRRVRRSIRCGLGVRVSSQTCSYPLRGKLSVRGYGMIRICHGIEWVALTHYSLFLMLRRRGIDQETQTCRMPKPL